MTESVQESALVATFEQAMHHHFTQVQRGLLPSLISPLQLKQGLDVNCRGGAWAIDMALSYPGISMTGLDNDASLIDLARHNAEVGGVSNTRFYQFDPLKRLPLANASFDLVHSLQILPVYRPREWPIFLSECKRVLKPNAPIVLVGLWIGPTSSFAYHHLLTLFDTFLINEGFGFSEYPGTSGVGVHLYSLLEEAGFANPSYSIQPVNFGGPNNSGGRACCHSIANIAKRAKPRIIELGLISDEEFDTLLLQKQRDLSEDAYCTFGALITAVAFAPN